MILVEALLTELEAFGETNDAANAERSQRMLNITRDTGEFLAVMVKAMHARRVLEVGTSNGYSTLWLAWAAAAIGGRVTTLEASDAKIALARENFARAGLADRIALMPGDAGASLAALPEAGFDLVFLDSERGDYPAWWSDLKRVLRPGGLLVVDNALSHAGEMAPFIALVSADPAFTCCTLPVGKGEFLATRSLAS